METTYEVWKCNLCTGMEEFAFVVKSHSRAEVSDLCYETTNEDYVYFIKYPNKTEV